MISNTETGPPNRRKWRPQLAMSTVLLLMAAVAAWISAWVNERQLGQIDRELQASQKLSPELIVLDVSRLAVIHRGFSPRSEEWEVFIPVEGYSLSIATENLLFTSEKTVENTEPSEYHVPLPSGRHRIAMEWHDIELKRKPGLDLFIDDQQVLSVDKSPSWTGRNGSSHEQISKNQRDYPSTTRVKLKASVFNIREKDSPRSIPKGPSSGLLIWLEPASATKDSTKTNPSP